MPPLNRGHGRPALQILRSIPLYSSYLEDRWPCAGGLSAVNVMGAQLRDLINSNRDRPGGG